MHTVYTLHNVKNAHIPPHVLSTRSMDCNTDLTPSYVCGSVLWYRMLPLDFGSYSHSGTNLKVQHLAVPAKYWIWLFSMCIGKLKKTCVFWMVCIVSHWWSVWSSTIVLGRSAESHFISWHLLVRMLPLHYHVKTCSGPLSQGHVPRWGKISGCCITDFFFMNLCKTGLDTFIMYQAWHVVSCQGAHANFPMRTMFNK